jgi:hypothetical protein
MQGENGGSSPREMPKAGDRRSRKYNKGDAPAGVQCWAERTLLRSGEVDNNNTGPILHKTKPRRGRNRKKFRGQCGFVMPFTRAAIDVEGRTQRSRKNGGTPVGYSGPVALRGE